MRSFRRKAVLFLSIVVLFGVTIYIPFTVFFSAHSPEFSLLAKSWKEILLLAIFLLLAWEVTVSKKWRVVLADRLVQLSMIFAGLHIILFAWHFQGTQPALAGMEIDLRGVLIFVELYIATKLFWPELRGWAIRSVAFGAAIIAGFAVLQVFLPRNFLAHFGYGAKTIEPYLTVDKSPGLIRENSTLRGPNPLGAIAGSSLLLLVAFWAKCKKNLTKNQRILITIFVLSLMVGLIVSYSRSAWLGFGLAAVFGIVLTLRNKISRTVWVVSGAVLIIVLGSIFALRGNVFVSTVFFHDNPTGSVTKSDTQHEASLQAGVKDVATHPLGFGIGSTGSASLLGNNPSVVENQYLFAGHEAGWLGLGLFIWLFGLILWRLFKKSDDWLALGVLLAGICLAVIGLMLPVFTDDTTAILWWGLAGVALGSDTIKAHGRSQSSHKKAARNA